MSDQDKQQAMEAKGASAISLDWIIRLCAIGALAYWSIVLVQPFLTIAAWSVILTVALYPAYERLALTLGGRAPCGRPDDFRLPGNCQSPGRAADRDKSCVRARLYSFRGAEPAPRSPSPASAVVPASD